MTAFKRASLLHVTAVLLTLAACTPGTRRLPAADPGRPAAGGDGWSRFRGPNGSGVSPAADVPLEWSATKNVVWKAELPGRGASSPILWGDRVYVTAYTGYGLATGDKVGDRAKLRRHLLCLNSNIPPAKWRSDTAKGGATRVALASGRTGEFRD